MDIDRNLGGGSRSNSRDPLPNVVEIQRASLKDEILRMESDVDGYSSEELEYLPYREEVRNVVAPLDPITSEDGGLGWPRNFPFLSDGGPPLVDRKNLTAALVSRLSTSTQGALIIGPAGSGKSTLVHRLFSADPLARQLFPRVVTLDCAGLRMVSTTQFERAATWSLFGSNEDAFRRFVTSWWARGRVDGLISILRARLRNGGLFVLDHFEHVSRSKEMDHWLATGLLEAAREHGFKILICERSNTALCKLPRVRECKLPVLKVGNLDEGDVAQWLTAPFFGRRQVNVSASDIARLTGGAPRLIRDFSNWIACETEIGPRTLKRFLDKRPRRYVAHCERFMASLRAMPSALIEGNLSVFSKDRKPNVKKQKLAAAGWEEIRDALLATGVVHDVDGRLEYVSPVHERRVGILTSREAMALMHLRTSEVAAIHYQKEWAKLGQLAEIAVDPIAHFLVSERNPRAALRHLQSVFQRWGFKARLYLRDRDNARLFLALAGCWQREWERGGGSGSGAGGRKHPPDQADDRGNDREIRSDRLFPLSEPEFVRAVQTGRSLVTDADHEQPNELIIPVVGYSGGVELVVRGRYCRANDSQLTKDIVRDTFVTLLRGLRQALSQVLDRFWTERGRRVRERLLYRMNEHDGRKGEDAVAIWSPSDPQAIARLIFEAVPQTQPSALAVLRRSKDRWCVASFRRVGGSKGRGDEIFGSPLWARPADVRRLDRIVRHPSRRGLVLGHEEAATIFPMFSEHKDAVAYLRPVWIGKEPECRIVVYQFMNVLGGGLDGSLQQQLSNAAPAIAMAS